MGDPYPGANLTVTCAESTSEPGALTSDHVEGESQGVERNRAGPQHLANLAGFPSRTRTKALEVEPDSCRRQHPADRE